VALKRKSTLRRALVVHAHPNPESLSSQLRDAATRGLEASGYDVQHIELYGDGFQAAMTRDERIEYPDLGAPIDPLAIKYATMLAEADTLVFVYPTWWFGMPAIMKGWFDRVFVPGVAFHLDVSSNKVKSDLGHVKRLVGITTTGADRAYVAAVGNAGKWTVTRTLRLMCSPLCRTTWLSLDKVEGRTEQERAAFIQRVEAKLGPS
jgi:NAD(P)H dehydrogenase (quinone)